MIEKMVTICNKTGLHARPASEFVACAGKFKSRIKVQKVGAEENVANAKSIISILTLCLIQGTQIIISANGEDEQEAAAALAELIESGFGEDC